MPIPGYQEFMLPLLRLAEDGKEHRLDEAMELLSKKLGINEEDQAVLLPSGTQTRYYNRVTWAVTYLTKSLLLQKTARGRFRIAPRGIDVLKTNPSSIDNTLLAQFAEYAAFKTKKNESTRAALSPASRDEEEAAATATPDERLDRAYRELRETLADELLERVHGASPTFFEHLVIDLLVKMGYGGSRAEA